MNAYEITYIIRPDLEEEGTRAAMDAVTARLEGFGAEIVAAIPWNPPRRRMAYPIRDFGDGFYVTTVFRLDPANLRPFENALRLNENILRFLLVQATETNIRQAQQRLIQQQQAAAAPRPQPAAPAEGVAPTSEMPSPAAEEAAPEVAPEPVAVAVDEPAIAVEEVSTEAVIEPQDSVDVSEPQPVGAATETEE